MKVSLKNSVLVLFTLFGIACTDEVDLNVESAPPELVVDACLSNDRDLYVKLSQTAAFFDNSTFSAISGARVSLYENDQELVVLTEDPQEPGMYRSSFRGRMGPSYKLRIEINGGAPDQVLGLWWSETERIKRVPQIDSLKQMSLNRNTNPQVFEAGDYAVLYFGDFEGQGDYYRILRTLNDSVFAQEDFFISDENFDGFYLGTRGFPAAAVHGPFEEPEPGQAPDTLSLGLQSVSESFFDYMQVLSTQVQTGTPFDAPPALVLGNIHREDNPESYAFGFFRAVNTVSSGLRYEP